MRPFNLKTDNTFENISLENVPNEFSFVDSLAKKHAITVEALQHLYEVGYAAAITFKLASNEKDYNAKAAWVVEQTIKKAKADS